MLFTLVGYDAHGSDGTDEANMLAIYDVLDDCDLLHLNVRIPANTSDVEAGILSVLPPTPGVKRAAQSLKDGVPSWALWSEEDALTWFESNINEPLVSGRASSPQTLTLATARIAIVSMIDILDQMASMLWALARMVIAMRIHIWHH